jgi:hypothetical protein
VVDRLIQQALLHVLQPILDPTFSEHNHGFRPGRRAHDAVLAAQAQVLRRGVDVERRGRLPSRGSQRAGWCFDVVPHGRWIDGFYR